MVTELTALHSWEKREGKGEDTGRRKTEGEGEEEGGGRGRGGSEEKALLLFPKLPS